MASDANGVNPAGAAATDSPYQIALAIVAALDRPNALAAGLAGADGVVDRGEWAGGGAASFSRLDRNADGRLTAEELAEALVGLAGERTLELGGLARACLVADARYRGVRRGAVGLGAIALVVLAGAVLALANEWAVEPQALVVGLGVTAVVMLAAFAGLASTNTRAGLARRRLVRRLALLAAEAGVGLEGRTLAASVVMVLDRKPGAWLGGLSRRRGPTAAFEAGDGRLDAAEWGAPGLPEEPGELAAAIERLAPARRQAVADAVDAAIARATWARLVADFAAWAGYLAVAGLAIGGLVATGLVGHGHAGADPATGTSLVVAGGVLLALYVAGTLGAGRTVRGLRETLALGVREAIGAGSP